MSSLVLTRLRGSQSQNQNQSQLLPIPAKREAIITDTARAPADIRQGQFTVPDLEFQSITQLAEMGDCSKSCDNEEYYATAMWDYNTYECKLSSQATDGHNHDH